MRGVEVNGKTKAILAGVALAAVVGIATASASDGGGPREPWTKPIEPPQSPDEVAAVKQAMCTCYRGGAVGLPELVRCALKQVYADVPWDQLEGNHAEDHPSLNVVRAAFVELAKQLLQVAPEGLDAWCADLDVVVDPVEPVEPPPPPPPPGACNFSGCPEFDATHKSPAFYMQRLQTLGYVINPAGSILSDAAKTAIRKFQRDSNKVRAGKGLAGPAALRAVQGAPIALAEIQTGPKLDDDGFLGNQSIAAIERAHRLVITIGLAWDKCVALS
jgi:hypothetical protein